MDSAVFSWKNLLICMTPVSSGSTLPCKTVPSARVWRKVDSHRAISIMIGMSLKYERTIASVALDGAVSRTITGSSLAMYPYDVSGNCTFDTVVAVNKARITVDIISLRSYLAKIGLRG